MDENIFGPQEAGLPQAPRAFDIKETLSGGAQSLEVANENTGEDGKELLGYFIQDIGSGMTKEQAKGTYPEFGEDYIDDLFVDAERSGDIEAIYNAYPELQSIGQAEENPGVPDYLTKNEEAEINKEKSSFLDKANKVSDIINYPIDKFTEGAIWLGKHLGGNIVDIAQGGADLGQNLGDSIAEAILPGEQEFNSTDTTISENLLDIGGGGFEAGLTTVFPGASLLISGVGETDTGKAALKPVSEVISTGGKLINKIPGLSDYRESLPEDRKADFDAYVGQGALLGLFKGGKVTKDFIIKKYTTDSATALEKTIYPTAKEIEFGIAENSRAGVERVIKTTEKPIETYKGLGEAIKPQLKAKEAKLNGAITKIDKVLKEKGIEVINKGHDSILGAIEQLKDVYSIYKGAEGKSILADVNLLDKAFKEGTITVENIQALKRMHTSSNKVFNESGVQRNTMVAEDLASIRRDLKGIIEENGIAAGVKNIKAINSAYGELINANILVKRRITQAQSYFTKRKDISVIQNILGDAIELIKYPVAKLLRDINSKGGELNILEAESQISKIKGQLEKAGVDANKIESVTDLLLNTAKVSPNQE